MIGDGFVTPAQGCWGLAESCLSPPQDLAHGQVDATWTQGAFDVIIHGAKAEFSGLRIGYPRIGAGLAGGDWEIIDEELGRRSAAAFPGWAYGTKRVASVREPWFDELASPDPLPLLCAELRATNPADVAVGVLRQGLERVRIPDSLGDHLDLGGNKTSKLLPGANDALTPMTPLSPSHFA